MKNKKLSFLVAAVVMSVSLSGCGLQVIKKDQLQQGLADINSALGKVQNAICTAEGQEKIDKANAIANALIEKYGSSVQK